MNTAAAQSAKRAAMSMDAVIGVVAFLTMAFSLGNIQDLAMDHGTNEVISWFLAPAVDLALIGALVGDAFLSRHGLDAGPWAKVLRWFAGLATLTLNVWDSVAVRDAAGIVLHAVPPVLLFFLAEAAVPYRRQFAAVVRQAEAEVDTVLPTPAAEVSTEPVHLPTPEVSTPSTEPVTATEEAPQETEVDTWADTPAPEVDTEPARLPAHEVPAAAELEEGDDEADTGDGDRLSAEEALEVIENAWRTGVSTREAARLSTRGKSYVSKVYARLEEEHKEDREPVRLSLAG